MHCIRQKLYQTVISIDLRSSEMPPLPNILVFSNRMLDVYRSLESTLIGARPGVETSFDRVQDCSLTKVGL